MSSEVYMWVKGRRNSFITKNPPAHMQDPCDIHTGRKLTSNLPLFCPLVCAQPAHLLALHIHVCLWCAEYDQCNEGVKLKKKAMQQCECTALWSVSEIFNFQLTREKNFDPLFSCFRDLS